MEKYFNKHTTQRLHSSPISVELIPAWSKFFDSKEAIELFPKDWTSGPSIDGATKMINRQLERREEGTLGLQAIYLTQTNQFIGMSGLLKHSIAGKDEIEVGYHFLHEFWGNGYAPEIAHYFLKFAFDNFPIDSVISLIDKRNVNSQRVARKNGLEIDGETELFGMDFYIFRIHKKAWESQF